MKKLFMFAVLLVGLAAFALARDPGSILPTTPLDPDKVIGFAVAIFGGVGVKGLTEILKKFLKWDGYLAVLLSAVVSIGVVGWFFAVSHMSLNIGYFVIYAALVFLNANGLYKAGKPTA